MKRTTKPIWIAILAWMVVAQTAHGWYCPSVGRWLSRDPIEDASPSGATTNQRLISMLNAGDFSQRDFGIGETSQTPSANLYCAFKNNPISFYDALGLKPCTATEINTCTYKCKIDYPGSNAKQNCDSHDLHLLVCRIHRVDCNCQCTCFLIGGVQPDPGDPMHYNYAHYECPGFGGIGGRVPKSIPIPQTLTEPCADIKNLPSKK